MSSSIFCWDIVYKGKGVIIICIYKLEWNLSLTVLSFCLEVVSRGEGLLISNKVFKPGFDTSFVHKPAHESGFKIFESEANTWSEISSLLHSCDFSCLTKLKCFKDCPIRHKSYTRSSFISFSDNFKISLRDPFFKSYLVDLSMLVYSHLKPGREGVYYWCSYSVKSSWNLIGTLVKLSSCMEYGIYCFQSWFSCFRVDIYWNTSSVIMNSYWAIFIENCGHISTVSCKRLINCIINDFLYHMMKSSSISTTNIHSRSLSHRFKSL